MQIEAVSEVDSISTVAWDESETIARWNGRDLSTVTSKHHEDRISSIALSRARFENSQMGYILCKSEKNSDSSSENRGSRSENRNSDDKVLNTDEDTKKAKEEPKTDVKNSLSLHASVNQDNHGQSSQKISAKHRTRIEFKNGNTLDITGTVSQERREDRFVTYDRTSGEIDASYNY